MKPIAPNTLIQNRYLVVQLIGKGGMGEVYLAVDQRLGSAIALKRTFFTDDDQLRNAFEREARTLARLRHPALPKVSDHFTEEETQYLVMDHISGDDISHRLEQSGKPFPLGWALFWADQLLDALTYLHNYEPPIIHRDIKPQNLKLTSENNIILLDFGLSKNSIGETRVTTTGSIVGYTPHYAPMEQIRGTGTDARSDIYSLSATLYQILTNVVPSDALTRADAILSGFSDPIKPISEINPEISKAISDVILKGMEIGQDRRYSSARDMQKDLRDAYSRTKTGSLSRTGALNSQAQVKPSQIVTEVIHTPPISSVQPQINTSQTDNSVSNRQNFNYQPRSSAENVKASQNFEETLKFDEDLHGSSPKQADIKTEVFIAGSSPEIAAAQNGDYDKKDSFEKENNFETGDFSAQNDNYSETGKFGASESFSAEDDFSDNQGYSPDATTPLFSLDKHTDEEFSSNAVSNSVTEAFALSDVAQNSEFVSQQNHSSTEDFKPSTPVKKSVAPAKSKGNSLAIAAGIGAFLLIAVGAVSILWYISSGEPKIADENPAPTPQATVEITPTPEPTLEAVTNTSSEDTNSNTNANSSIQENLTNTDTTDKTTEQNGKTKRTQVTQPTPARISTPNQQVIINKTPTPAKTPTPKKTPVRGSSSDILP